MNRDELLRRVRGISTWRRGSQRAPHKPLLMLYALGRLQLELPPLVGFRQVDEGLGSLLREFGPPRQANHPEYPFWRLQNDGLWALSDARDLPTRASNTDPLRSALLERDVRGGFPPRVHALLAGDEDLRRTVALELLHEHFPRTIHEELLTAVSLPAEWASDPAPAALSRRRPRRSGFSAEVLAAYGYACAVCGFDAHLARKSFGLDAAHIRWHQANGPDEVTNSLALCALHHRALDRGVIGLGADLELIVSHNADGTCGFEAHFLAFAGQPLRQPHSRALAPDPEHVRWHQREVFHGPARAG